MKASSTLLTLSVLALLAAPVRAIPRKDVLECVLPDGGRATLTSRYDWSPLARIIPADVAERLNQDSWKIVFEATASRSATSPPRSITYSHRGEACLELGLIDGTLFVGTTFLKPDGTWFRTTDNEAGGNLCVGPVSIRAAFSGPRRQTEWEKCGSAIGAWCTQIWMG
jgi:hypothetical protein